MAVKTGQRFSEGFSLVELMVGMVLGLMLIAGAVSIYLASKRSYVEVEQVAALTESARFAEQIMGDSLRQAGFFGEVTANKVDLDSNLTAVVGDCTGAAPDNLAEAHDLNQFVYARTATGSTIFNNCIDDVVVGTDVLVVKHVRPRPLSDGPRDSFDPNDPSHGDGVIDTPEGLDNTKTYVMTNNVTALMFDGDDTAPSISIGGAIPGGTAWEYQYEVLYIRDAAVPQLSRKTLVWNGAAMELSDPPEDLAEGVEHLRVRFGYDSGTDGEVDTYGNAAEITAAGKWAEVESVEVFMRVRSVTKDVQYTDTKSITLPGEPPQVFNDGYRRLLSHSSVSLRNLKLMIRGGA